MKKIFTILAVSLALFTYAQNVGINSTGVAPNASAMLDIDAAPNNDKGLLIPRVPLLATNNALPVTAPANSLVVYNTATAGISPNNVVPGFYYWDGTKWIAFGGSGGTDWSLTGNAGTAAGANFIGTTDAVDFTVFTNNTEKVRVTSIGNVGIGTAIPNASALLDIDAAPNNDKGLLIPRIALLATNNALPVSSPANSLVVYNTATAGIAPNNVVPGFYYWNGTKWIAFGGSGGTDWSLAGNAGTVAGTNFIGTTDAVDFTVFTNNTEKVRVTSTGDVGIGTTPGAKLHVVGGATLLQPSSFIPAQGLQVDVNNLFNGSNGIFVNAPLGWVGNAIKSNLNGLEQFAIRHNGSAWFNGSVGIGTPTPGYTLDVAGSLEIYHPSYTNANLTFSPASSSNTYCTLRSRVDQTYGLELDVFGSAMSGIGTYNTGGNGAALVNVNNAPLALGANNIGYVYITGAGNVGIGITNPSYLLDVQGGDINASGNVRSAGSALTSDIRLKRNVLDLENGISSVMKLRPVSYQKKTSIEATEYTKEEIGFIAQEVQKIFPKLVSEGNDKDRILALDYNSLIPVLTKAMQEQQKIIEAQQKAIDKLSKRIEVLEKP